MSRRTAVVLLFLVAGNSFGGAVRVTTVASEGVLISDGESAVLIDAFVNAPSPWPYYTVPDATWSAMLAGDGEFGRVVASVASHEHADHINASDARAWLEARPGTPLYSTPAAIRLVREAGYEGENTIAVTPWETGEHVVTRGDVTLTFFFQPHGDAVDATPRNIATLVEIGEKRVLHVGDISPVPQFLEAARFSEREIDLLLLPQWFFLTENHPGAVDMVKRVVAPKAIAVTHMASTVADRFDEQLAAEFPDVHRTFRPGDVLVLE